jgi:ribosome-associated heat shock protein Hsp15
MDEFRAGMRIDKWLWAARFFKTRSLATAACEAGHVVCNEQTAKPSRILKAGDRLRVKNEGGEFAIEVLTLSENRGSASVAAEMFRESGESKELRAKAAEARRAMFLAEPSFARSKPSKKDRRLIHSFRGRDER